MRNEFARFVVCFVVVLANEANGIPLVRFFFKGKVAIVPVTVKPTADGTVWTIEDEEMFYGTLASPVERINTEDVFKILEGYEEGLMPNSVNPKYVMAAYNYEKDLYLEELPLQGVTYKDKVLTVCTINTVSLDCRLSFVEPEKQGLKVSKSSTGSIKILARDTEQSLYNKKFNNLTSNFEQEEIVILEKVTLKENYEICLKAVSVGTQWRPKITRNLELAEDDTMWWSVVPTEVIYSDENYSAIRVRIVSKLQVRIQFHYSDTRSPVVSFFTGPAVIDNRKGQLWVTTQSEFTMDIQQTRCDIRIQPYHICERMKIKIVNSGIVGNSPNVDITHAQLCDKHVTVLNQIISDDTIILHFK